MSKKINVGDIAKHKIHGHRGVVIARTEWHNNYPRLTIQPQGTKDGKPFDSYTYDEPNLEFVDKSDVTVQPAMRPADPVSLGDRVRDRLTGIEGVAIAITHWHSGCSRILVQPQELHEGKPIDATCVDEFDAVIVTKAKVPAIANTKGGPRPEPRRR
jgi:heat shock protein HspQ